jgi:hypothetical protein
VPLRKNSVGTAQGSIQNALLSGSGALELAGTTSDQYVDLPNGIISALVNSSFEAWLTWRGANSISLYLDGQLQGSVAFAGQLAQLSDINNWLGRSQFSADPALDASLDEFRIYRTALGASEIAASFAAGPNPPFLAR